MERIHILQELLHTQIKALQTLAGNENPASCRKKIRYAHQQLACYFLELKIIPPASINQWLKIHTQPLGNWLPDIYEELPINREHSLFDLEINDISEDAFYFLHYTGAPNDYQTKPVIDVIEYCTGFSEPYQSGYVTFRTKLSDKKHAVLSESDLKKMLDTVHDPFIKEKIKSCYEIVDNWKSYRACPNCGYTLHYNFCTWQCGKYNTCGKISGTRYSRWNFTNPAPFDFDDEEIVYRLKHGVHSSVLVPGIPEWRIFSRLKSKYQVELYPNIDRNGDIRVVVDNENIDLDVKSYRNPDGLATHIRDVLKKNIHSDLPIFVIPNEYTASSKKGYIPRVKSFFASEDGIQIISESKLLLFLQEKVE